MPIKHKKKKKHKKTTYKSVTGEQRTGWIQKDVVYQSVTGEGELEKALIFIKINYKNFTQPWLWCLPLSPIFIAFRG